MSIFVVIIIGIILGEVLVNIVDAIEEYSCNNLK